MKNMSNFRYYTFNDFANRNFAFPLVQNKRNNDDFCNLINNKNEYINFVDYKSNLDKICTKIAEHLETSLSEFDKKDIHSVIGIDYYETIIGNQIADKFNANVSSFSKDFLLYPIKRPLLPNIFLDKKNKKKVIIIIDTVIKSGLSVSMCLDFLLIGYLMSKGEKLDQLENKIIELKENYKIICCCMTIDRNLIVKEIIEKNKDVIISPVTIIDYDDEKITNNEIKKIRLKKYHHYKNSSPFYISAFNSLLLSPLYSIYNPCNDTIIKTEKIENRISHYSNHDSTFFNVETRNQVKKQWINVLNNHIGITEPFNLIKELIETLKKTSKNDFVLLLEFLNKKKQNIMKKKALYINNKTTTVKITDDEYFSLFIDIFLNGFFNSYSYIISPIVIDELFTKIIPKIIEMLSIYIKGQNYIDEFIQIFGNLFGRLSSYFQFTFDSHLITTVKNLSENNINDTLTKLSSQFQIIDFWSFLTNRKYLSIIIDHLFTNIKKNKNISENKKEIVFIIKDIKSGIIVSEMSKYTDDSILMKNILFLMNNELLLENIKPKKNQIYIIILDTLKTLYDIYDSIRILTDSQMIGKDQIFIATLFDFNGVYENYLKTEKEDITYILKHNLISGIKLDIKKDKSKLENNSEDKFDANLNIEYTFTIPGL